jgi:hypothetical protein
MVDVSVCNKNLLEFEAELGEATGDSPNLVAGVDDNRFMGLLVAQDSAVALQRADGEGFEDHGTYFKANRSFLFADVPATECVQFLASKCRFALQIISFVWCTMNMGLYADR